MWDRAGNKFGQRPIEPDSRTDSTIAPVAMRPIPQRAIWWCAAALLLIAVSSTWLLIAFFGGGSPQDRTRLQAIRLAGSIAVGTGGTAALILAARRQRATELGLLQQERAAADTRHDAEERRISDLQASAGEQLGSDKAAVRLNGLYQLERLGQNYADHRQTVVNVICAYLRMPFTHPDAVAASEGPAGTSTNDTPQANTQAENKQTSEELQVRLTAQRILAEHLRPDIDRNTGNPTNKKFWSNINLDLTGARLIGFDLSHCCVETCQFNDAHFQDIALFSGAHFRGAARFGGAHFEDGAGFNNSQFTALAWFERAYFKDMSGFYRTQFQALAWFNHTQFEGPVRFVDAHFEDPTRFVNVRCRWDTDRTGDIWPDGWTTRAPENDKDGHIEGRAGVWGYVVEEAAVGQSTGHETARG